MAMGGDPAAIELSFAQELIDAKIRMAELDFQQSEYRQQVCLLVRELLKAGVALPPGVIPLS